MDIKPLIRSSAGNLFCGLISSIIIVSTILFPKTDIQGELKPVFKGPRPYKQDTAETSDIYQSISISKRMDLFSPIIADASEKYGIDPALIKAIIMAESSYNPSAVSNKGAVGLMQIMPATATSLGVENLFDPEDNVDGGVKYLKWLLNQFRGDEILAVAAYNAGRTNVRKYQGIPPYKATQYYVKKVFEYYEHYQRTDNINI